MNLQTLREQSFCVYFPTNNQFTYSAGGYLDFQETFILFTQKTHIIKENVRFHSHDLRRRIDSIILKRTYKN